MGSYQDSALTNKMIKLVILDFDGTLADTREPIYIAIKTCLEKKKICLVPSAMRGELGRYPLEQHLEDLGVSEREIDEAASEIKLAFVINLDKIKPAPYLFELEKLEREKVILTNNDPGFIKAVLRTLGVNFFSELYGPEGRKDKSERMQNIMKKHKSKPEETVYFGDKASDVSSAKKAGCWSVGVASRIGWDSRKMLLDSEPDFIIGSLKEVGNALIKIESF